MKQRNCIRQGGRPEVPLSVLWQRVERRGPDECWPYRGWTNPKGYGVLYRDKRAYIAHRWFFEQMNGPIPDGQLVLHSCDNPPCCNPRHLRLGTSADNAADRQARNRGVYYHGEQRPTAKLTERDVREIRREFAGGVSQAELARRFGVVSNTIHEIVRRKSWQHI